MLNHKYVLSAACVAAAAGLFVVNSPAQDATVTKTTSTVTFNVGDKDVDMKLPAGISSKDFNADRGIENAFETLTESALAKNGLDNIVGQFVDQDRDRIKQSLDTNKLSWGNMENNNSKRFTDAIAALESSWKGKYNAKFELDKDKVFTKEFIHIQTGEVSDPQQLVGKWPVTATELRGLDNAQGKMTQADADQAKNKAFGGDVNLEKGRNIAIAHIVGSHNMPGVHASLIKESAKGWQFDVPNTLTAPRLYENIVANLNYIEQNKASLPGDVNDGYRMVSHAMALAIYDVNLTRDVHIVKNLDAGAARPAGTAVDK